jgi:asparaginyl-tRNA synthetase
LNDNMDLAEDFIQYVIKYIRQMSRRFEISWNLLDEEKSKPQAKRNAFIGKIKLCAWKQFQTRFYTEAIDILRDCT